MPNEAILHFFFFLVGGGGILFDWIVVLLGLRWVSISLQTYFGKTDSYLKIILKKKVTFFSRKHFIRLCSVKFL